MILLSHFGKSRGYSLLNCVFFVCPVGFVVNKSKDKGCSFSEYIKLIR